MTRLLCASCRSALNTAQAAIRVLDDSRITNSEQLIARQELLVALRRLGKSGPARRHNLGPPETGTR
jgi:hypothetical protein